MQVKVMRKIFRNSTLIQPGTILNIEGNRVPVWAKAIDKKATAPDKVEQQKIINQPQKPVEQKQEVNSAPDKVEQQNNKEQTETTENLNSDLDGKTEIELAKILDAEITKAVEKNILIEDTDKKSVLEQIIEIRTKLAEQEA